MSPLAVIRGLFVLILLSVCAIAWSPWFAEYQAALISMAVLILLALFAVVWRHSVKGERRIHSAQGWLAGLSDSGMGYALCDRNGQLLDCNRVFAAICQMPQESLLRQNVSDTLLEQSPAVWPELRHCILAGTSWHGEIELSDNRAEILAFPLNSLAEKQGPHLVIELSVVVSNELDTATSQMAMDRLPAAIVLIRDNSIHYVNDGFTALFGWLGEQIVGQSPAAWLGDQHSVLQSFNEINQYLQGHEQWSKEARLPRSDGKLLWCHIAISSLVSRQPERGLALLVSDATELRRREESLRQAAVVFEAASDAILVLDAERKIRMVNAAFTRITGYQATEVLGRVTRLLMANRQPPELYEHIFTQAAKSNAWQGEIWSRKKDGSVYPEWTSVNCVRNEAGQIVEYVVIASDITARKRTEERLNYQANYDALTELPNRSLFVDRLRQAIARAKREGTQLALLFVDLDRFKNINDTMGHSAGDKLLVQVANALRGCVRESDTIARFGGDEFALILSPIYGPKNASTVAQSLLEVLSKPVVVDGYECVVAGSIGISLFPGDGHHPEELLKNADAAMYRAKDEGRNTYQFFTQEMQQLALARVALERDLRYAIERNEFLLHYQPQIGLRTGAVVGLEVLVRWQSVTRGFVSPSEFIGLCEENGQIVALGEWVLRQACTQYMVWYAAGIAPETIAVNVSGRQFRSPQFLKMVENVLETTQIPPAALELELTESFLMEDEEKVLDTLNQLRQLGLTLSVDDFGTGYSSLSYLKRFPISTLKIDKSFVQDVPDDDEDAAIVAAILRMATALKLEVVAEGVETAEQLHFLKSLDCDIIQGYYFSKPLSVPDCSLYLAQNHQIENQGQLPSPASR